MLSTAVSHAVIVRAGLVKVFMNSPHTKKGKLATFEKMTVTGMYLRVLNVFLLHYPFMSNPRYCLGCATQKIDLHSFIFLQLLILCPVHNPFLPILRQPAGKAQLSPFSTKNVSRMCLEGSIIPLICLESKMISPFTHNKWRGLNHQIIALQKGYLRNALRLFS